MSQVIPAHRQANGSITLPVLWLLLHVCHVGHVGGNSSPARILHEWLTVAQTLAPTLSLLGPVHVHLSKYVCCL